MGIRSITEDRSGRWKMQAEGDKVKSAKSLRFPLGLFSSSAGGSSDDRNGDRRVLR